MVATQWRVGGGMNGSSFIGLDYGAVKVGFDLAGIEITPSAWRDLRDIEACARDALNGRTS